MAITRQGRVPRAGRHRPQVRLPRRRRLAAHARADPPHPRRLVTRDGHKGHADQHLYLSRILASRIGTNVFARNDACGRRASRRSRVDETLVDRSSRGSSSTRRRALSGRCGRSRRGAAAHPRAGARRAAARRHLVRARGVVGVVARADVLKRAAARQAARRTPGGEGIEDLRFTVGPLDELPDWIGRRRAPRAAARELPGALRRREAGARARRRRRSRSCARDSARLLERERLATRGRSAPR